MRGEKAASEHEHIALFPVGSEFSSERKTRKTHKTKTEQEIDRYKWNTC